MRIIGKRKLAPVGPRSPTADEVRWSEEMARGHTLPVDRKGVIRYRSQEDANADMERWIAKAMARRALGPADRTG